MTLEEFKKLCDAATPGPWQGPFCFPETFERNYISNTIGDHILTSEDLEIDDAKFIAACREMVPKLIAVAEASQARFQYWNRENYIALEKALESLNETP